MVSVISHIARTLRGVRIVERRNHATMASAPFKHPEINRDAADVGFVVAGPLAELEGKRHAYWLGTWIWEQGRKIDRTLNWASEDEKQEKFADSIRPRKNQRIARHLFKQRKQGAVKGFDFFVKDLKLLLMDSE